MENYLACKTLDGKVCNALGSDLNCGPSVGCGTCRPGYKGETCNTCAKGAYLKSGSNGQIDTVAARGVECSSMICFEIYIIKNINLKIYTDFSMW